jgi:hypothetical protein
MQHGWQQGILMFRPRLAGRAETLEQELEVSRLSLLGAGLLAGAMLVLCSLSSYHASAEESERAVSAEQLPPAVLEVFMRFDAAGSVTGFVHEIDGDEESYAAQVTVNGGHFELKLSPSGSIMEVEVEDDDDDRSGDDEESEDDDEDGR